MLPSPNFNANVLPAINPASANDAAFDAQVIDLAAEAVRGAQFLLFAVHVGAIGANLAALKVQESDTKTNDTTLGGSPTDVLDVENKPTSDDDNTVWLVTIDLRGPRKRYLQLQATAGASATLLGAVCYPVSPHEIQDDHNAADHATG